MTVHIGFSDVNEQFYVKGGTEKKQVVVCGIVKFLC